MGWIDLLLSVTLVATRQASHLRYWSSTINAPTILRGGGLFIAGMDRFEASQAFLESRRKSLVRLDHIAEQGIATSFWNVESVKESGPRRLIFIRYITVPGDRVGS